MAADVKIDIAAEFTGAGAFKKAETATDKLSKTAGRLGKAFIGLYSTQKLLAYGKASLQAAVADEKAQRQLALALKNVGLGRDVAASESYIQKLQKEFGVLDDALRPAYQTLAIATQDTAESQRLLQIALDISASTGRDLGSVTSALSKAFLGSNTALSKLGVGISKADLKTKSFQEITEQLATTFAGSATESANSLQGSMDKLAVASNNAKEIIGEGLVDALQSLSGDNSVDDLADSMEGLAQKSADAISGIGILLAKLKENPILGAFFEWAAKQRGVAQALGEAKRINEERSADRGKQGLGHLAELESKYATETLKTKKKITVEESKQLKSKQLQLAIDKAKIALGKGEDVFDINKIQLAAAQLNQAEQLGKVTSQAQLLQITNDMARLRVKQDIDALEAAIAAKDIKAIEAGTAKLNKDLGILGALTGQELKLRDIESILKDIVPKDLINIANLDEAIGKLKAIATGFGTTPSSTGSTFGSGNAVTSKVTNVSVAAARAAVAGTTVSSQYDPRVVYGGQRIDSAGNYNAFNPAMLGMTSGGGGSAKTTGATVNVTVVEAVDPQLTAQKIKEIFTNSANNTGNIYDFGTGSKNTTYVV